MPDRSVLIVGPAIDEEETARSLANMRDIDLPGATKVVVTRGKFDAEGVAKTFNVDSGYPAEIAELHTLATVSGHGSRADPRFRDGYDLFCVRRLLERYDGFDLLLLLRDPDGLHEGWPDMVSSAAERLFAFGPAEASNLLLNLSEPRFPLFLELAWNLYRMGSAYALQPYSLAHALAAASEAADLIASLRPASAG